MTNTERKKEIDRLTREIAYLKKQIADDLFARANKLKLKKLRAQLLKHFQELDLDKLAKGE